jgi:hypothetical protein
MDAGCIADLIAQSGHTVSLACLADALDDLGARVNAWTVVSADMPAWVQDAKTEVVESYARRELHVTHAVYILTNPGIREGWRVTDQRGRTFSVIGFKDEAGLGLLYRIDCSEHVL